MRSLIRPLYGGRMLGNSSASAFFSWLHLLDPLRRALCRTEPVEGVERSLDRRRCNAIDDEDDARTPVPARPGLHMDRYMDQMLHPRHPRPPDSGRMGMSRDRSTGSGPATRLREMTGLSPRSGLHRRQGKAPSNFSRTLPAPQSEFAQELIRDPYSFDLLALVSTRAASRRRKEYRLLVSNVVLMSNAVDFSGARPRIREILQNTGRTVPRRAIGRSSSRSGRWRAQRQERGMATCRPS